MDIDKAKELVIEAGLEIARSGLISRTWGNVSCRVSDTEFVITPSGRAYDRLSPKDIAVVRIADGGYEGNVLPSSEKNVHAAVYRIRPDIGFVIHTHQDYASAVSALDADLADIPPEYERLLGKRVFCAKYAVSGSRKLVAEIRFALCEKNSDAMLIAHHGVLCMGEDIRQAFDAANELEAYCRAYVRNICGYKDESDHAESDDALSGTREDIPDLAEPYRTICREIYAARPDISAIAFTSAPFVLPAAEGRKKIYPHLDDFAQILGVNVRVISIDPIDPADAAARTVKALRHRNGVIISGIGALCCGSTPGDAIAARHLLVKNCRTLVFLEAKKPGRTPRAIPALAAFRLRRFYLASYAPRING